MTTLNTAKASGLSILVSLKTFQSLLYNDLKANIIEENETIMRMS